MKDAEDATASDGLTDFQAKMLDLMKHGCGLSAAKREYTAAQYRQMEELVEKGLAVRRPGVPWAKAGTFAKA